MTVPGIVMVVMVGGAEVEEREDPDAGSGAGIGSLSRLYKLGKLINLSERVL